jgi:hypothetical protein
VMWKSGELQMRESPAPKDESRARDPNQSPEVIS